MNNSKYKLLPVYWVILGILGVVVSNAQPSVEMVNLKASKTYRIGSKSVLKLEGSTNVNTFTFNCTEPFRPQSFALELDDENPSTATFRNTKLSIPVNSLDSGNKMMNKDMFKALNSDKHPNITIELLKVRQDKCNLLRELKDWLNVKALARVTINGTSREHWLNITANKISNNRYRFIGNKKLCMSDFGIEPPTAMMGVVKVKDEITISLDLDVIVE